MHIHKSRPIVLEEKNVLDLLFDEQKVQGVSLPNSKDSHVIPQHKPVLRDFIHNCSWLAVENAIILNIYETQCMSVYAWINYLTTNPNKENVCFILLNQENKQIGKVYFNKVKLIDHCCELYNGENTPTSHYLKLEYQSFSRVLSEDDGEEYNNEEF